MTDEQTPAKTRRVALTLQLDLRPEGYGPSWYIDAFSDTQRYFDHPIVVTPDQAHSIAEIFNATILQVEGSAPISPVTIIEMGSEDLRHHIEQQIQHAQKELERMNELRQKIGVWREQLALFDPQISQAEQPQVRQVNPPRKVTRSKQHGEHQ